MNVSVLYEAVSTIVNRLPLEIRLRRVLRDFVLGVLASRSCLLESVAYALHPRGSMESQYRRLQRFLANPHVDVAAIQQAWATVVIEQMRPEQLVLLVDETLLSNHLKVMVLGIWTEQGCVPIAWRSVDPKNYPDCGQVELILDLVQRVLPAISCPVILLADRGIGTSPDLIAGLTHMNVDILFRVQGTTRLFNADGKHVPLAQLGIQKFAWQAPARVFKKAGWLSLHASVAWADGYAVPWCLVSSRPVNPHVYRLRFHQEIAFRDLKSDGFQWHRSHVWLPDHADRLLLVLAIAYWLVMLVGQSLPPVSRGRTSRFSTFRRGLDAILAHFRPNIAAFLPPPPFPPPRITCVVQ